MRPSDQTGPTDAPSKTCESSKSLGRAATSGRLRLRVVDQVYGWRRPRWGSRAGLHALRSAIVRAPAWEKKQAPRRRGAKLVSWRSLLPRFLVRKLAGWDAPIEVSQGATKMADQKDSQQNIGASARREPGPFYVEVGCSDGMVNSACLEARAGPSGSPSASGGAAAVPSAGSNRPAVPALRARGGTKEGVVVRDLTSKKMAVLRRRGSGCRTARLDPSGGACLRELDDRR